MRRLPSLCGGSWMRNRTASGWQPCRRTRSNPRRPTSLAELPARRNRARATSRREVAGALLRSIGPGVITGGADNDPAGVATYSIVGATAGFAQNWLLLISTPMLIVVEQMSAKVANVTKTDLANLLRTTYGARIATPAVLLMVVANVITMGADLLAMGAALQLLTGLRFVYWVVPLAVLMADLA